MPSTRQAVGDRRRIYLNEFNVLMDGAVYLPLVSGLLQAYAEKVPVIRENYRFMSPLFIRSDVASIVDSYDDPAVAAFSVFMWNERLSLAVAKEIKRRWPACIVMFGGQQVPPDGKQYLRLNPAVDVVIHGEGEVTFAAVLQRLLETRDLSGIGGVCWRDPTTGECRCGGTNPCVEDDLDRYPSPYLSGHFDRLLDAYPKIRFQAIIQTNRGCPFSCAYCSWHGTKRLRLFSLDRIRKEIEWCGTHRIEYVFNADANFGILPRDLDIARMLVDTKQRYGYPQKFRSCFTKNADDRIFQLSLMLMEHGLEKGVTLSFQSLDETALANVGRRNIRLSTYRSLLERFNQRKVPIYTELILGLPGETKTSWIDGIRQILESGLEGQLFVYPCEVYPNAEMGNESYQARHRIETVTIPLTEIHGRVRTEEEGVNEVQEIVVGTATMPRAQWREMMLFSWLTMTLFSLKLGFWVLHYLRRRFRIAPTDFIRFLCSEGGGVIARELEWYSLHLDAIVAGERGRGVVLPSHGEIYWDVEEASFFRIVEEIDRFYGGIEDALLRFLSLEEIEVDRRELAEIMKFQRAVIPLPDSPNSGVIPFAVDIPEFVERPADAPPSPLTPARRLLHVQGTDYGGDRVRYAREVILWGRKSERITNPVSWTEGG